MGKKQHQKDRLYLTAKEWKEEWGGHKVQHRAPTHRLPFYCCALSFTNFEDPVCTADGTVFDITNIVPFIGKHHTHPVTGEPLELSDLIPLTFHKNADGEYECPVMKKVFNQACTIQDAFAKQKANPWCNYRHVRMIVNHSHIVAVKTSGNVYSHEAVHQFNIKMKSLRDLITNEPFTKQDIITLQNPINAHALTPVDFAHVKQDLKVENAESDNLIRNDNHTMRAVLDGLKSADGDGTAQPSSKRQLALAQLESALRERRLAKSKTAASHTKGANGAAGAAAQPAPQKHEADAEDSDEDDYIRGPTPAELRAAYKPGASTWDTDDTKEANRKIGKRALSEAAALEAAKKRAKLGKIVPAAWWAEHYKPRFEEGVETVGAASRSATATTAGITTRNERVQRLVYRNPKEKGYLTLHTTKGSLNMELRCDLAPRTCENFLALCEMGYYTGTPFHRSIRNFMVQGGDPTGSGTGGESIYGPTFEDEFHQSLKHDRRGVLAMANSGKHTNGSQFYILYKSAAHLDWKHTVFGAVVGALETLTAMEGVKTDSDDKPLQRMEITGCTIHKNPFREMIEEEEKAAALKQAQTGNAVNGQLHESLQRGKWFSNPQGGVKQLAASSQTKQAVPSLEAAPQPDAKTASKKAAIDANEFDAW